MRRVLLLRHGKSKRGPEYDTDFERPLAGRGKRDSVKLGAFLVERDLVPDLIYSSPAKRARRTAERCARAAGYEGEIWLHDALYMGGVDAGINDAKGGATRFGSAYNLSHELDNSSHCFPYTMGLL